MVGGRNIHPYVMAMSYGATFISTSAIVGFGGVASLFGMSLHWLTLLQHLLRYLPGIYSVRKKKPAVWA